MMVLALVLLLGMGIPIALILVAVGVDALVLALAGAVWAGGVWKKRAAPWLDAHVIHHHGSIAAHH